MLPTRLASSVVLLLFLLLNTRAVAMDQTTRDRASLAPVSAETADSNRLTVVPLEVEGSLSLTNADDAAEPVSIPVAAPLPTTPVLPADHAGLLNSARQFALGMIETGNDDSAVGGLGEVSRFQIMPSVWRHYNASRSYRNPNVSAEVARQHWAALYDYFKQKANREPTDFDMYVLWNTRHGYYAGREFSPARLHPVVRDRAERFANLVEDGLRRESRLAMAGAR